MPLCVSLNTSLIIIIIILKLRSQSPFSGIIPRCLLSRTVNASDSYNYHTYMQILISWCFRAESAVMMTTMLKKITTLSFGTTPLVMRRLLLSSYNHHHSPRATAAALTKTTQRSQEWQYIRTCIIQVHNFLNQTYERHFNICVQKFFYRSIVYGGREKQFPAGGRNSHRLSNSHSPDFKISLTFYLCTTTYTRVPRYSQSLEPDPHHHPRGLLQKYCLTTVAYQPRDLFEQVE